MKCGSRVDSRAERAPGRKKLLQKNPQIGKSISFLIKSITFFISLYFFLFHFHIEHYYLTLNVIKNIFEGVVSNEKSNVASHKVVLSKFLFFSSSLNSIKLSFHFGPKFLELVIILEIPISSGSWRIFTVLLLSLFLHLSSMLIWGFHEQLDIFKETGKYPHA